MIVDGIEVSDKEIQEALKHASDSYIHIPNADGTSTPLTVVCKAAVPEIGRIQNVQVNIKRDILRFLHLPFLLKIREEPIAIVGGGPSLKNHLDEIRKYKWIMAAGSSHDFLVENGIIPTFAAATDPKDETADYYLKPHKDTCYLLASQCPPKLFDQLKDYNVAMWHFHDQVDEEHYQGEQSICWGCMVGVNCIQLALYLGFQQQHYFGYDCSIDGSESHAYRVADEERAEILSRRTEATIGEGPDTRKYWTTTALICQATHFFGVYSCPDGRFLKGKVYGDGMLAGIIKRSPGMEHWLETC